MKELATKRYQINSFSRELDYFLSSGWMEDLYKEESKHKYFLS